MKKLYNINGKELGIDFRNVLCFRLKNKKGRPGYGMEMYDGKELTIIMGNKLYNNELVLDYSYINWDNGKGNINNETINENVKRFYYDLIEYFKNEK